MRLDTLQTGVLVDIDTRATPFAPTQPLPGERTILKNTFCAEIA